MDDVAVWGSCQSVEESPYSGLGHEHNIESCDNSATKGHALGR